MKPTGKPFWNTFWKHPVFQRLDALAALITVSAFGFLMLSGKTVNIGLLNLLDDSWEIDVAYRLSHGSWLGRDVLFTYGPLYEFLTGLPSLLAGQSDIGFIYRTLPLMPLVACVVLVYWIGASLLNTEPVWKRVVFFVVLVFFWCPLDVRRVIVVFVFAVLVRAMTRLALDNVLSTSAIASLLVVGAFLVSADAGIYSVADLVIVVFWAFCFQPSSRKVILRFGLITTGLLAALVFLVNLFTGGLGEFRLWRSALAVAGNYRWAMAAGLKAYMIPYIVGVASATAVTVVVGLTFSRSDAQAITRRPLFLCSGFCVAIFGFQSGLVRSDWGHVTLGMFPALVLIALVLFGTGPARPLVAWPLMGVALFASATVAYMSDQPWAPQLLLRDMRNVRTIDGDCPSGTQYFQQACIHSGEVLLLNRTREFLATSEDTHTFVFPYENVLAVAAGKLVAGGVLQSYSAHGEFLMNEEVESLRRFRPELAIYGQDGIGTMAIDQVPNFSRSPKVWFYLQQGYQFVSPLFGGFVGLRRNDARSKSWREARETNVGFVPRVFNVAGPGSYDVGRITWTKPYDFLRLDLRINYPPWWKLSKPASVAILLHFADGSNKKIPGVFPPNQDSEFWIYPWEDPLLLRYFLPDAQRWRSGNHPLVTEVGIEIEPYDQISVLPSTIEVRKIEAVSIGLESGTEASGGSGGF